MKLGEGIKQRLEPVSLEGGGLIGYFDSKHEDFFPLESLNVSISVDPEEAGN